jgi:hypothetical protein
LTLTSVNGHGPTLSAETGRLLAYRWFSTTPVGRVFTVRVRLLGRK